jgi:hypothetical protein
MAVAPTRRALVGRLVILRRSVPAGKDALEEPPQLDGAIHPADPDAAREGITDICLHLLA